MSKDNFGDRMKDYEKSFKYYAPKRMPVIIRLDGKAFHTYTKGMDKPFDKCISNAFWATCEYLCANIMGCKVAYHQSDEITLLLTNDDTLTTQAWFNNNIQKMASIASSMATAKFNEYMKTFKSDINLALFDARVFIVPKEEVNNVFLWRQQDAIKNSISMVAHHQFGHKSLHKLNSQQKKDKLLKDANINWEQLPIYQKRGVCIIKKYYNKNGAKRSYWAPDFDTPLFNENKNYIEQYLN